MEVIAFGLVFGIWIAWHERKTQSKLFPPSTCIFCNRPIRHGKNGYYHTSDKTTMCYRYGKVNGVRVSPQPDQPWERLYR